MKLTIAITIAKRLSVMILLGIILLCLSSVSALQCYQETANISNSCGAVSTGNYAIATKYFYINYTKPSAALNMSYWVTKFGSNGVTSYSENVTLNNSCWNGYSDKVVLRFFSNVSTAVGHANDYGESYGQCFNSTSWINITSNSKITVGVTGSTGSGDKPKRLYDGNWLNFSSTSDSGSYWDDSFPGWSAPDTSVSYASNARYAMIWEEAMVWNITDLDIQGATFRNVTYETSTEVFTLNYGISTDIISTSATFYYNGSSYPSTTSCTSGYCTAVNSLSLPNINVATENHSLYWTVTAYNGTGTIIKNSSFYNQTVNQIAMTLCTSGSIVLNFTAYDERNKTRQNGFSFDGSFQYSASGTNTKTLNVSNTTATEIDICINANTTYYIDGIIAYSKGTYPTRNWFYQSYPITNVTTKVPLYLLDTASSTSFILQVQDKNLQPVKQVLVNAQRCYPGNNTYAYESVFIHRTDSSGLTVGNLEAETALYQFLITNQSQTLLAVTPCAKVIPQSTPYTLLFQLGVGYVSPFTNIQNVTQITSTWNFNNTNNILTWTYVDTSGIFNISELIVSSLNVSGSNKVICDSTNNLPTGIITCNITQAGTYTADAYVLRGNQILVDQYVFSADSRPSQVGYYGVFLGIFLIIIGAFAFKFNEIAGIVLINIIIIFENIVGLINFGPVFITAIVGISAIIIGVLER